MIFLSWNVKGITEPLRTYLVRNELLLCSREYAKPDFVCLQEVKVVDF